MVSFDSEYGTRVCRLVGPVGFEPTTSGPDLLGVTSAPGSPSITGLWYPLGGVNPLDQARRIGMSMFRHSAPSMAWS